jgi:hypothetical protein
VKRKPTEWENIFANCSPDKGLKSKIYKKLNSIVRINNLIENKLGNGSE